METRETGRRRGAARWASTGMAVLALAVALSAGLLGAAPRALAQTSVTISQQGDLTDDQPGFASCPDAWPCTSTVTGPLTGTPFAGGTFVGTLTTDNWVNPPTGGLIADGSGAATIAGADPTTGSFSITYSGTYLNYFSPESLFGTFEGTFTVTGGTGPYAGATGSGTIAFTEAFLVVDLEVSLTGELIVPAAPTATPTATATATTPPAAGTGASVGAKLCQKGGFADLRGLDGTRFATTGECVSFAASGGVLVPIPTATTMP